MPDTVIEDGPPPITKSTSATFKFRSSDPVVQSFDCRLDSGVWAACSSPTTYTALPDGTHVFLVRAKNVLGQADQSPASRTWRVDTVPPDTTITSAPREFSSSATAEFAFVANEADVKYQCRLNAGVWEPCVSPKRYVELAERGHTFQVRGTDAAGNLELVPASYGWTVDLTSPETTITSGPSDPTWSDSATFAFTSSEPGSFQCSLDGAAFAGCSSPHTYTGLSDGRHAVAIRALDRAGNPDRTPAQREWTAIVGPSITLSGTLKQAADTSGVLAESDYDLFVSAYEPNSGATHIKISVDGVEQDFFEQGCSTGGCRLERSWTFPTADFPRGQHVVQVTARDGSGRARSRSFLIATDPPDRDEDGPEDSAGRASTQASAEDDALEPEARMRWPDTFAGLWQVAEGHVFIAFTRNASENVGQLRQDFPGAGELVPVTLPRSLVELEALQDRMIADRAAPRVADALPLPERYDLGIDVKQNTVYAVVEDLDPKTQLAFTTRYGSVQVRPGLLAEPERCTRANCRYELRAGLAWGRSSAELRYCSSAFAVRTRAGNWNLLSAAHCQGDDRYHGGERYGSVQHQQFRGRVDAERHSIEGGFTASPTIFVDSGERRRIVEQVSRWEEVRVGRRVCKSGWRTGKTCGPIEDKTYSPGGGDYPNDANRYVLARYCARGGDSGAAVFRGHRAYGVHSGGERGPCDRGGDWSIFSHIEYVQNALDVHVVTQSGGGIG